MSQMNAQRHAFWRELRRRRVFRTAALYVVAAWVVLQVTDVALSAFGFSDTALRYVFGAALAGFPLSLVFGWYFDITAEGIVRTPSTADSADDVTLKKTDYVLLTMLTVVLGIIAYGTLIKVADTPLETAAATRVDIVPNSIAVLPFSNFSADPNNAYFSEGLSEELLNVLTRIPELHVFSRTSAFSFQNEDLDVRAIAARLGAANILEGSVRADGNRIRITAQLIDATLDKHVWSETYDRDLEDIFAVQDDIAANVAQALSVNLGVTQQQRLSKIDPRAYGLVLESRHLHARGSNEDIEHAISNLLEAIELQPDYAVAYSDLARLYINQSFRSYADRDGRYALARAALNRALDLDPYLAETHVRLGFIAWSYDNDIETAEKHIQRALQLDPRNVVVIRGMSGLAWKKGDQDTEIEMLERAAMLDPVNVDTLTQLSEVYRRVRRFDDAEAMLYEALDVKPDLDGAHRSLAYIAMSREAYDEAIDLLQEALAINPDSAIDWATIAQVHNLRAENNSAGPKEDREAARFAANRALEIDSDFAWAYLHLGSVLYFYDWDWAAADAMFGRAKIEFRGSTEYISLAAQLEATLGRLESALEIASRGPELAPLDGGAMLTLGIVHYYSGNYEQAGELARKASELESFLDPSLPHYLLGFIALQQDDAELALASFANITDPLLANHGHALAHCAKDRANDCAVALQKLERNHADLAAYHIAQVYARRDDADSAFRWLDRAYNQRDAMMVNIKVDPLLLNLRTDERWPALLERMDL